MFTDKRFGEYNSNISPEEKMMKRFALEQQVWKNWGQGAFAINVYTGQAKEKGVFL